MVAIGLIANGIANKARTLNAGLKGYTRSVFKNTAAGTTTGILCETLTTSLNDPGILDIAINCGIGLGRVIN